MANRINAKSHLTPNSLAFGSSFTKTFAFTVGASQANTVVQDYVVLPIACKIPIVTAVAVSATNGVSALNVVIGSVAEAGVLVADNSDTGFYEPPTVNTTAGLSLFQTGTFPNFTGPGDQAVAISTAYGSATYYPSEPDAIFPQGTVLTARIVSGGGGNGGFKIDLLCIEVDIHPTYPLVQGWTWGNANIG